MAPNDSLTLDDTSYCLAKEGEFYIIYAESGANNFRLSLENTVGSFNVNWYDPRNGGELQNASITSVKDRIVVELGTPTSKPEKDWVILIRKNEEEYSKISYRIVQDKYHFIILYF